MTCRQSATRILVASAAFLAASILLSACSEEEQAAAPEPVRAIKYMTLTQGVAAQQRRMAGVVAAGTTSVASFETAGKVIELKLNVGDRFATGDLLARLDPEPFRLRLNEATGGLQQAEATLADASSKYRQQKQLFDKGLATRTTYESTMANLRNASGAIEVERSQVQIAERNLAKNDLRAPIHRTIASSEAEGCGSRAHGREC
mgnify:CR=1 FL=1